MLNRQRFECLISRQVFPKIKKVKITQNLVHDNDIM